jgi:acyl dehydratase
MVHRASLQMMKRIGNFHPAMLVHGEQAVSLHRPIPPAGKAVVTATVSDMFDKGRAAVVVVTAAVVMDDEPLCSTRMSMFIRGAGGWGGDRGPSAERRRTPDRTADHTITYQTSRDQAFIYRLNGDRNPLHTDPSFAGAGGFDRPILHGLCSYGFTGRGLLHLLCDGDPARFLRVEARFASPVVPGEVLTIAAWDTTPGEAVFTTSVADRAVIDHGLLKFVRTG